MMNIREISFDIKTFSVIGGKGERTISNAEVSLPLPRGLFLCVLGFLYPIPHIPWLAVLTNNPQFDM